MNLYIMPAFNVNYGSLDLHLSVERHYVILHEFLEVVQKVLIRRSKTNHRGAGD